MDIGLYRRWAACLVGLAVLVVATAGCGGGKKKVTVTGTVTYKGQKLTGGMVKFVGTKGESPAAAMIQKDGTYTMTDVDPGEMKVGFTVTPQSAGRPGEKKGSAPKFTPDDLPEKYRDPEQSGLRYTITPETHQLDVKID